MTVNNFPSGSLPAVTGNSGRYLTTNGSGIFWGAGGNMTLIGSVAASGSVVNIENIPQTYTDLKLVGVNLVQSGVTSIIYLGANNITGTSYYAYTFYISSGTVLANTTTADGNYIGSSGGAGNMTTIVADIFNYADTANSVKTYRAQCSNRDSQSARTFSWGEYASTTSSRSGFANITSLNIRNANSWTSGTFYLYGVK